MTEGKGAGRAFDEASLIVDLVGRRTTAVPLASYPRLRRATAE